MVVLTNGRSRKVTSVGSGLLAGSPKEVLWSFPLTALMTIPQPNQPTRLLTHRFSGIFTEPDTALDSGLPLPG